MMTNMHQATYSLVDLLYRQPQGGKGVFATSGAGAGFPKMLAFDPAATFVLTSETQSELAAFITAQKGNLIGFALSYELGMAFEEITAKHPAQEVLGVFYAYSDYICFDGEKANLYYKWPDYPEKVEQLSSSRIPREKIYPLSLGDSWTREQYQTKFDQVIAYIKAGDIYQVNLTQKIDGEFLGRGVDLFYRLTEANSPLYGGYLGYDDFEFLSQSPECFLKTQGPRVITQPIKGTRAKGENPEEEIAQKKSLLESKKEEAELFMITDLMRNDLAKSCKAGTVQVNKHKEILSLNRVIHSYSEVEGRLKTGTTPLELLLKAFPGGSVTGCPKRRAMEIIDELEDGPRGYYTGAFGFFDAHGDLHCSVNIRSLIKKGKEVSFQVGGGVTALSRMEEEFNEMEHKKNSVLSNLEQ